MFVRRTLREDRMLYDELPGYPAYAARVRWRIARGIF
jgi:protein-S-isoprenylcysteine O-methyltransferase Ste14